jgi:hypothetical protein
MFFVESWIPLTTIDQNKIERPIYIKNREYFIDKKYNIYNSSRKQLKTKIENHLIWYKEKSTNRMISEVRNINEKPKIMEVPYEWEKIMFKLFLLIPYSFEGKKYSTEEINTHLVEMNDRKITILFEDKMDKKIINGKIELFSPYLYKLSIREKNEWKRKQILFLIPIKKNSTRLIVYNIDKNDILNYLKVEEKGKSNHRKIIVKWLEKYNRN